MPAHPPYPPDIAPQCTYLMERIDELLTDLSFETEAARARHWRQQIRTLKERARRLGCFNGVCLQPVDDEQSIERPVECARGADQGR